MEISLMISAPSTVFVMVGQSPSLGIAQHDPRFVRKVHKLQAFSHPGNFSIKYNQALNLITHSDLMMVIMAALES
jgi:hypothetical protein